MIIKYHHIYVYILRYKTNNFNENNQIIKQIKSYIAYSTTGKTKYLINFLFNLQK